MELIIIGAIVLVALIIGLVLMKFIGIWIRARVSNAPVGLLNLVAMWIRKVSPIPHRRQPHYRSQGRSRFLD